MNDFSRQPFDRAAAECTLAAMTSAWECFRRRAAARAVDGWEKAFAEISRAHAALVHEGLWVSGPSDMMRILGVSDLELMHSKMVAWLLTPTGRHGLADRLLRQLLEAGWGTSALATERALVRLEVTQVETRADIVAFMPGGTLVIENKVWATEGPCQCEALFTEWAETSRDVRFLLLNRDGHPPLSTRSEAAASAWRSLSYAGLAALLDQELSGPSSNSRPGEGVAQQYLKTIRTMFGQSDRFAVTVGRGNVDGP